MIPARDTWGVHAAIRPRKPSGAFGAVILSNVEAKPGGRAGANGCGRSTSSFLGAQPEHGQLDVSEVVTPGSAWLHSARGLQNPISVRDNRLQ